MDRARIRVAPRSRRRPRALPTLVPLGRVPGTSAEALVNLEAAGLVEVVGSEPAAAGIVHAAAVALAGLPWASAGEVILVGFGEALAATAAHLRFVPTFDGSPRRAERPRRRPQSHRALRCAARRLLVEVPTGSRRRWSSAPAPSTREHLEWLRSTCSPGNGIAALVVADNAHGSWAIDADADPTFVAALRVALEPISLPETDFDAHQRTGHRRPRHRRRRRRRASLRPARTLGPARMLGRAGCLDPASPPGPAALHSSCSHRRRGGP